MLKRVGAYLAVCFCFYWTGCSDSKDETLVSRPQALGERMLPPRPSHIFPEARNLIQYPKRDSRWSPYEPGVVLVKFKNGLSEQLINSRVAKELGLSRVEKRGSTRVDRMRLMTQESVEDAVLRIRRDPRVVYAEPNWKIQLLRTPNDPRFNECWGLNNTSQTGGTADADIDALEAWNISVGSRSVVVAVLDTGVDYTHPDLADNMWINTDEIPGNGIDDDNNGYIDDVRGWDFENEKPEPMDDYGHGSHCSGTIGAVGNNGIGVAGVNWYVKIMPLRIIGAQEEIEAYCEDASNAIHYAVENGAQIMSCSWWTLGEECQTLQDAVQFADEHNVFLVAAAGNDSRDDDDPTYHHLPSEYPFDNVISVAATNHKDELASFSNYGPTTVDVGAPGEDILSTVWPGHGYDVYSGTSMAAPHTAGTVALILSIRPELTKQQVREVLFSTVDPIADLQGKCVSGGRINVQRILQTLIEGMEIPPVAVAGGNQMVLTGAMVGLDGSNSYDPNQQTITYHWELQAPEGSLAQLSDPVSPTPTFVADNCGIYKAILIVTDSAGYTSAPDVAKIHVMNLTDLDEPVVQPPYEKDIDQTWTIVQPGAVSMSLHFSSFDTEKGYDFVYILDANDQQVAVYDGQLGEFNTVAVEGNTIKVHFVADQMYGGQGFVADKIQWCDAGLCPKGKGDCDDLVAGCETDTTSDIQNCGWCGHACNFPHANAVCNTGICTITGCKDGYLNCDGNEKNGCESNPVTDPNNCGGCNQPCQAYPNASAGCANSGCALGPCNPGWDNCDTDVNNGCERSITTDINNCGGCNQVCALPHAIDHTCIEGICYPKGNCAEEILTEPVQSSHPYDFNAYHTWEISRPGSAEIAVHFNQFEVETNWDYVYIYDAQDNLFATYTGTLEAFYTETIPGDTIKIVLESDGIVNEWGFLIDKISTCQSSCDVGYANCDLIPENGCEAEVSADINNCGGCGKVCGKPNTVSQCVNSVCNETTQCVAGFGDCDNNTGNGCESDLNTDAENCNVCGKACSFPNASGTCVLGQCQMGACNPGYQDCDQDGLSCETSVVSDPNNCGECDKLCELLHVDVQTCESSTCRIGYAPGGIVPQTISTTHPYPNPYEAEWTLKQIGAARLRVHFSKFATEKSYDYVRLYDSKGVQIASYNGKLDPFNSDWINGDTIKITIDCDTVVNDYGFDIDQLEYEVSGCTPNWGNCDGVDSTGCEMDVSSDGANCGACGAVCQVQHATGGCQAGACVVETCDQNWGNCNQQNGDGCEADLLSDPLHCNVCDSPCIFPNAEALCDQGSCKMGTCLEGFKDCDQNGTSCEVDITTDPSHCGGCEAANLCQLDNAVAGCAASQCTVASCVTGYGNCDNTASNGCEKAVTNDDQNCGACGKTCLLPHAQAHCVNVGCQIDTCDDNYKDCDGDVANGCEIDTLVSNSHCGGCNQPCELPNALEQCQEGSCTLIDCEATFGNCNQNPADGCESTLMSDPDNCSTCGKKCELDNASSICSDGTCVIDSCLEGFDDCNKRDSDGCEFNVLTDVNNCGECGHVCILVHATGACEAGTCVVSACSENYGDCNETADDGCEEFLSESMDHCGECGKPCELPNAVSKCFEGVCGILECNEGFANCNREHPDGCEAALATDLNNCGACGTKCTEGQVCQGSECSCPDGDQDTHGVKPCGDDCDDTKASVYPGAQEICKDSIDNNCDGLTDEGCPDEIEEDTGGGGCGCGTKGSVDDDAMWLSIILMGSVWLGRRRSKGARH